LDLQAEQVKREAREAQLKGKADDDIAEGQEMDQDEEEDQSPDPSTSASVVPTPRQFRGTLSDFYSNLEDEYSDPRVLATVILLDARDPSSWRISDLEVKMQSSKCHLVIALTKVDLVPLEVVATWVAHLSATVKCPIYPICSPEPAKNGIKARASGGIANLAAHLNKQCSGKERESGEDAIAIIGIENCGKTCLSKVLAPLFPSFSIIDTPPIVAASSRQAHLSAQEEEEEEEKPDDGEDDEDTLRLRDKQAAHRILIRNSGFIFKVREPLPLVDALMERVLQVSDVMMAFNVPAFTDTNDFLIAVARTQGRLKKGAVPDTIAAARHVLRGWSTGEVGYYSKPPNAVDGVEEVRVAIVKDHSFKGLLLSRKEWRQAWKGKELRLTTGSSARWC
jgi:nuclear GTP-binding protein